MSINDATLADIRLAAAPRIMGESRDGSHNVFMTVYTKPIGNRKSNKIQLKMYVPAGDGRLEILKGLEAGDTIISIQGYNDEDSYPGENGEMVYRQFVNVTSIDFLEKELLRGERIIRQNRKAQADQAQA